MKRLIFGLAMGVFMVAGAAAWAGYTWEYADGKKCEFGMDVRVRYDVYERDTLDHWSCGNGQRGPNREYFRIRERVWGKMDLWEGAKLMLRLGNRWHYETTSWNEPNNQHDDGIGEHPSPTWEAPDEVYIDNLYLELTNIMDSPWSLKLGRQDIVLGNGMVLLEGTPFDQGRSIYWDGAVATYQTECDTLKLLGLYNSTKDRTVLINDQDRDLRYGNTTVLGADWTHRFTKAINTEMYYLWVGVEDDDVEHTNVLTDGSSMPTMDADLNIVGARVFGSPTDLMDYSVEFAQQFGDVMQGDDADATGCMFDARLKFKAPADTALKPTLGLEVTYFSGDDPDSDPINGVSAGDGEVEGWIPVLANYPIWREELMPLRLTAGWTNLTQYRADTCLQIMDNVKTTLAFAQLIADYGDNDTGNRGGGGTGDNMGQLYSWAVDWKATDCLVLSFEGASFQPGNYYNDGQSCEWLRLQALWTY